MTAKPRHGFVLHGARTVERRAAPDAAEDGGDRRAFRADPERQFSVEEHKARIAAALHSFLAAPKKEKPDFAAIRRRKRFRKR